MDKVEQIREKVVSMMDEEMALFTESLEDGCSETSGAPVAYMRLQMLLSFIDSVRGNES